VIGRIQHYISRKAMDIDGLGDETVALLFEQGLITNIADLYDLKYDDLIELDGMADKSVNNLLDGIRKSVEVSFERVLFGLGIRFVGETVAKRLARHFKNIDTLVSAGIPELLAVDEIGSGIAHSVFEWTRKEAHIEMLQRMRSHGIQFESSFKETIQVSDVLLSKSVVVSGTFEKFSRDELKRLIEEHGGKNVAGISGKTDLLVAGENMGPAKLEKANKLGIRIISEEEFIHLISD
jgi:DNA ligase (NAD+)